MSLYIHIVGPIYGGREIVNPVFLVTMYTERQATSDRRSQRIRIYYVCASFCKALPKTTNSLLRIYSRTRDLNINLIDS